MPSHPLLNIRQSDEPKTLRQRWYALALGVALLIALPLHAQTSIYGSVAGVWEDSLYTVIGDIVIEPGRSLEITPGTLVRFEGNFIFDIYGLLLAEGTEDNPIVFYSENQWRGFSFHPGTSPNSSLRYCTINNAFVGVECDRAYLNIQFCSINAGSIGIKVVQANPTISNNLLIRASGSDTFGDVKAISVLSYSYPAITDNILIEAVSGIGDAYGIWIRESSPLITDNWIEVTSTTKDAIGIYANRVVKARIERNIVRSTSVYNMRSIWLLLATNILIRSNDLFLIPTSETGIGIEIDDGSVAQVTNNIVYGNSLSIGISSGENPEDGMVDTLFSGYNDFYNHRTVYSGAWQGFNDIYADPLFEQHSYNRESCDYRLSWVNFPDPQYKSPCIDAGSPSFVDDFEFRTQSDIGRIPHLYNPNRVQDNPIPDNPGLIQVFPNPFNSSTTLSFNLALPGQTSIRVFDLNGRQQTILWDGFSKQGSNRIVWSAGQLPAGEYLVRFELPGSIQTQRLIYLP